MGQERRETRLTEDFDDVCIHGLTDDCDECGIDDFCVHGVRGGCSHVCKCGVKCSSHDWKDCMMWDGSYRHRPETGVYCPYEDATALGAMAKSVCKMFDHLDEFEPHGKERIWEDEEMAAYYGVPDPE